MWKCALLLAVTPALAIADSSKTKDTTPVPCRAAALKLEKVRKLDAFKLPADCTTKGSGAPKVLASEAALREQLECKDPKAKLDIDFTKQALIATSVSYSPAQI